MRLKQVITTVKMFLIICAKLLPICDCDPFILTILKKKKTYNEYVGLNCTLNVKSFIREVL